MTPEQRHERNRRYYLQHREHLLEVARLYRNDHKQERRAYMKQYVEDHRAELNLKVRERRKADPERIRALQKKHHDQWLRNHPEAVAGIREVNKRHHRKHREA